MALAIEDDNQRDNLVLKMKDLALNEKTGQWKRFCGTRLIAHLRDEMKTKGNAELAKKYNNYFTEIKEKESNQQLKNIYQRF